MSAKEGKKKIKAFRNKKKPREKNTIEDLKAKYATIDEANIKTFSDFALSSKTLKGLKEAGYEEPTDIQKQSIGVALRGDDVLGAAKTGSGKTLAFLIPVLEKLHAQSWSRFNGLAAIIITPARELALQIFDTLKAVGKYHDFSAALIIGGQNLHFEKHRIDQCNIIICTPGRLLHHMNVNPRFDCTAMQILVIDEADRCLDMGFQTEMNGIIENLPPERQTLLFSATQTKSVKDLARLSLTDPMYISVHEYAAHSTPEGLQQHYVVCNLEDKFAMLWSFLKNHLKQKIIVFFSNCKQVKFMNEILCKMRPGTVILALHGNLHQSKRMDVYNNFRRKERAVLLATDIAARGLDFPSVNWVVQMDCPEDTDAYIHRAGRTARFRNGGESLLVLLPSELLMVDKLLEKKVPIEEIKINPNKLFSPHRKLEALLARFVEIKESAQRAVLAYVKSVHLMKDKKIFNVKSLDTDAYARSLGLAVCPRIRFLTRMQKNEEKQKKDAKTQEISNLKDKMQRCPSSDDDSNYHSEAEESSDEKPTHAHDKKAKNPLDNSAFTANDDSDDDDILTVKRTNVELQDDDLNKSDDEPGSMSKNKKAVTKAAVAKKILRKKIVANTKKTFDEEGQELIDRTKQRIADETIVDDSESGINIEKAKEILREEDKFDKQRYREKIRARHREERLKQKAERRQEEKEEEDEEDENDEEKGEADESDEESSASDSDGWKMPDPDKIYGPKRDSSAESDDEPEEPIHKPSKRKLITQDEYTKKKSKRSNDNSELRATEELALQLLQQ